MHIYIYIMCVYMHFFRNLRNVDVFEMVLDEFRCLQVILQDVFGEFY